VFLLSTESSDDSSQAQRPLFIVLALSITGGVMWGFSTVALSYVPKNSGMVPVFIAGLTAFVSLAITVLIRRKAVVSQWQQTALAPSVMSGVLFGVANLLIISALRTGTLALVGLLTALYPLATVLLARFILHERISRLQWAGVAAAILAAALLSQPS
jgi:drug/metabolite transporter (DMT)-like permease